MQELCCHPDVYELFMSELRTLGQANGLQGWEIPLGILLETNTFTVGNQLLTCTMKKSRMQLEKKYKAQLEALYKNLDGNRNSGTIK